MTEAVTDAAKDAATKAEHEQEAAKVVEDFDPERAMATIKKQRESEAAAIQRAKELEAELAKYKSAEEQKAEAEKALEVKLAERDEALKGKDALIAELHVRLSFEREAYHKGIADPALAYLAAKEQGLLGEYNPKEGKVGEHDWETLAEKYPSFAASTDSPIAKTGDAGARGKGATSTPGQQFNEAVRSALRR